MFWACILICLLISVNSNFPAVFVHDLKLLARCFVFLELIPLCDIFWFVVLVADLQQRLFFHVYHVVTCSCLLDYCDSNVSSLCSAITLPQLSILHLLLHLRFSSLLRLSTVESVNSLLSNCVVLLGLN